MPVLFSVVDSPRHPNLSALYQRLGLEEVRLDSQRKAIAQLKKQKPDIIVADFVYAFSTYYQATNISNLDVLLHSLIKYDCHPKVIVLADKSERQHVDKLNSIYPLHGVLVLPVKESELEALLQSAIAGGSETVKNSAVSHVTLSADNSVSDPRPIGVFDSGVGGLSVLRHLHARLPHEHLLYVADSAYIPYGDKPASLVRERSFHIADKLIGLGAKLLVVACNTATAAAIHELRAHYSLPIVGMEPGVKPGVTHSRSRRVGILATEGTLRSSKFAALMERYGAGAEVILQPCPGLVEQIERGALDSSATRTMLEHFLSPLLAKQIDTVVLGCTHYPFVQPLIEQIVGSHIQVIDTGPAVARHVERLLNEHAIANRENQGSVRFFTSGDDAALQPLFATLWGSPVELNQLV